MTIIALVIQKKEAKQYISVHILKYILGYKKE